MKDTDIRNALDYYLGALDEPASTPSAFSDDAKAITRAARVLGRDAEAREKLVAMIRDEEPGDDSQLYMETMFALLSVESTFPARQPKPKQPAQPREPLSPDGKRRSDGKLTPDDVREIRKQVKTGMTRRAVASSFGISHQTVSSIMAGRIWADVPDEDYRAA